MKWLAFVVLVGCGEVHMEPPDGSTNLSIDTGSDAGISGMPGTPTAAQLLAKLATCTPTGGNYATDEGEAEAVQICSLTGAVFWKADLDIDCDGEETEQCNPDTDPAYQNETSATDSNGDPLDAAALPYVVIPLPSSRFDYHEAGLELGSVVAVIYQDHVEYGVFGDEGPEGIIGEASYRMAEQLGIDPDPANGGTDSGVAYIAFTGSSAVPTTIEDHDEAVRIGIAKARALLGQ